MWDQRYAEPGYLFGKEPAKFLTSASKWLEPGSNVLSVADGEGRNSVYLASLGHQVTGFDPSPVAVEKARQLATENGVTPQYNVAGIEDWDWDQQFDAVVGIFIQFAPPDLRAQLFGWMAQAVAPGGLLLLHGYAPRQVGYGTGGPPVESHMYTTDLLADAFAGFEVLRLEDYDTDVDEGRGHSGLSALVDLVARKP
ncbi:MAG: SAM-dependent methyltransferase, partial [Paracoccaceae bacterium]